MHHHLQLLQHYLLRQMVLQSYPNQKQEKQNLFHLDVRQIHLQDLEKMKMDYHNKNLH
jgi:hypothetical protein